MSSVATVAADAPRALARLDAAEGIATVAEHAARDAEAHAAYMADLDPDTLSYWQARWTAEEHADLLIEAATRARQIAVEACAAYWKAVDAEG